MRPMPFKWKIALLSLGVSGILLAGFGFLCLEVLQKVGMDRMDREIKALAEAQLRTRHPLEHWRNFDVSLDFIYGGEGTLPAIHVRDIGGEAIYSTKDCPKSIGELALRLVDFRREPNDMAPAFPPNRPEDPLPEHRRQRPGQRPLKQGFPRPRPPGPPPILGDPVFQTLETDGVEWRVGILSNPFVTMTIAMDLAEYRGDIRRFKEALLFIFPVALLVLGLGSWLLAARAFRPVAEMTRIAETITARGLDKRLPDGAPDRELAGLAEVINGMLDRLEKSFLQAQRFSADAAHELQTPLAILQGELEQAIQEADAGSVQQAQYHHLLEEVQRLKAIVQKLLLLARVDAGELALRKELVDLSCVLREEVEDVEAIAPRLTVEAEIQDNVQVMADQDLLLQLLRNMVSNAVKYNCPQGEIAFRLQAEKGFAVFTLVNAGDPISLEERSRVFDRFYRVDKARSRASGGSGLGLSLAREIARAHGGDLVLDPPKERSVSFTLMLPL